MIRCFLLELARFDLVLGRSLLSRSVRPTSCAFSPTLHKLFDFKFFPNHLSDSDDRYGDPATLAVQGYDHPGE